MDESYWRCLLATVWYVLLYSTYYYCALCTYEVIRTISTVRTSKFRLTVLILLKQSGAVRVSGSRGSGLHKHLGNTKFRELDKKNDAENLQHCCQKFNQ